MTSSSHCKLFKFRSKINVDYVIYLFVFAMPKHCLLPSLHSYNGSSRESLWQRHVGAIASLVVCHLKTEVITALTFLYFHVAYHQFSHVVRIFNSLFLFQASENGLSQPNNFNSLPNNHMNTGYRTNHINSDWAEG